MEVSCEQEYRQPLGTKWSLDDRQQGTGPLRPRATRDRILPITVMGSESDTSSELPDKRLADALMPALSREPCHILPGLLSYRLGDNKWVPCSASKLMTICNTALAIYHGELIYFMKSGTQPGDLLKLLTVTIL